MLVSLVEFPLFTCGHTAEDVEVIYDSGGKDCIAT